MYVYFYTYLANKADSDFRSASFYLYKHQLFFFIQLPYIWYKNNLADLLEMK